MKHSFEYYALRYLLLWQQTESTLHAAMTSNPTVTALRDSLYNYRVSRSFKGIADDTKAKRVLSILRRTGDSTSLAPAQKVEKLTEAFSADFGRSNLSAATKLLWLCYQSPFKIFDSRAVRTLKLRGHDVGKRDYAQFVAAWDTEFSLHKAQIAFAADQLQIIQPFVAGWHKSKQSVRSLVTQPWFLERVFDNYLWEQGEKGLTKR